MPSLMVRRRIMSLSPLEITLGSVPQKFSIIEKTRDTYNGKNNIYAILKDDVSDPESPITNPRNVGFNKLRDAKKNKIPKSTLFTRMCKHEKCKKINCTFAHDEDELRDPECYFSTTCRKDECKYRHPEGSLVHSVEDHENYLKRLE